MSAPRFPVGTCDTHMHIYDKRYPVSPMSLLRPPDATLDEYRQVQSALGLQRVVVVQPTTYGLDNSCLLDAVQQFGGSSRAIVVVTDAVTDPDVERMTQHGVRGARFHMLPGGAVPWEMMHCVAERIARHGWHIQLQMNGRDLVDRYETLVALPTPLVVDHVGRYMPPVGPDDQRFRVLLRLVDTGRCWVKLSAPYESVVDHDHHYSAVTQLIHALVRHAPERMLWATNWPHPGQAHPPSLTDLHRLALDWMPDATVRRRILVDNPAELYQFDPISPSLTAYPEEIP